MLDNLYILNDSGEVILEKQWRGHGGDRTICNWFYERFKSYSHANDVPSVMSAPQCYVFHIRRGEILYIACCCNEMPPLMAIEMLERVHNILEIYFSIITEDVLRDNFITVYEIMEEMFDLGLPLTTEPSALQNLVPPKTIMSQVVNAVASASSANPDNLSFSDLKSSVPWRSSTAKQINNEVIFEIMEKLDMVMDRDGKVLRMGITGELNAVCSLSGIPDLIVRFGSEPLSGSFSATRFHACVRIKDWESKRILSFIPPEGSFQLMQYRIKGMDKPPFYVKPQIDFCENMGHVNVVMGIKNSPAKPLESVIVHMPLPPDIISADLSCNHGNLIVSDPIKWCTWSMDKLPKDKIACLSGTVQMDAKAHLPYFHTTATVGFVMHGCTISGVKLNEMSLHASPKYRYSHYFKSKSKAGCIEIRT